nr:MAG TPA: hypothetical protein [Caudoviricetes sp.]
MLLIDNFFVYYICQRQSLILLTISHLFCINII